MRVIVVGAGIMGLALAWACARRGHEVEVFEQGPIPNPLGSSVDEHRLIRFPYGREAGYTRMVGEAYEAWELLWSDLGERLAVETGALAIDAGGSTWAKASREALEEEGRPGRWLTPGELARRFPLLLTQDVEGALWHRQGGVLFAEAIVAALAALLPRRGVRLQPGRAVREVDPDRALIRFADGSAAAGDVLVLAAGAWVSRLLPEMASRVSPSRQVVVYAAPPDREAWSRSPMLMNLGPENGFYLVPPVAGRGLKIGDHRFTLEGDPDRDRDAHLAEAEPVLAAARRRLRGFEDWRIGRLRTCFYTVEPQERFVVEPVGRAGWVMSPCSGHGFKFGAVLGLRTAEALETGADISAWAAGRAEAAVLST